MIGAEARRRFMLAAGALLALLFILFVFRPAIERGGFGEFTTVALVFLTILVVERWVRSR